MVGGNLFPSTTKTCRVLVVKFNLQRKCGDDFVKLYLSSTKITLISN